MLVVTRLKNQEILVGPIIITVLRAHEGFNNVTLRIRNGSKLDIVELAGGDKYKLTDEVTITVLMFRNQSVRLGIDAPRSVDIYRRELHDAITHTQSQRHVA